MRLFLLGANGRTGRELIRLALEGGNSVTALVRSRDRLSDIHHRNLTIHAGSVCDTEVLAARLPANDGLISTLGPRWPTQSASAIYYNSAAAIVAAMARTGVRRLVVTSSALLFPADNRMARILQCAVRRPIEAAQRMEQIICTAIVDWTIVRTGFLKNGIDGTCRTEVGSLPAEPRAVSRAALARFLLSEIEQPCQVRKVVGLCG